MSVSVGGSSLRLQISWIAIAITIVSCHCCDGFVSTASILVPFHLCKTSWQLNAVPLSECSPETSFLSCPDSYRTCITDKGILRNDSHTDTQTDTERKTDEYVLSVAEEDDLPDISKLTVEAFGADAITLSGELSSLERALLQPGVGLFNAYTGAVAYAEVLSGLRKRMNHRLRADNQPSLLAPPLIPSRASHQQAQAIAAQSSLILVLAKHSDSSPPHAYSKIQPIATVELRLQPTDGKIPFSQPWFDNIERQIATYFNIPVSSLSPSQTPLQPYLSNLCVAQTARGRKIGKAMVRNRCPKKSSSIYIAMHHNISQYRHSLPSIHIHVPFTPLSFTFFQSLSFSNHSYLHSTPLHSIPGTMCGKNCKGFMGIFKTIPSR